MNRPIPETNNGDFQGMSRILITGATDGIGKQTAIELARLGHELILHGRSKDRLQTVLHEVEKKMPSERIHTITADFASLASVRSMAVEMNERFDFLNVLINNAGVFSRTRVLTEDGIELTFQVNHIAHYILTLECLALLKAGKPSRIVNVASMAHQGPVHLDDYNFTSAYDGYDAYSTSKAANIMFTYELSELLNPEEVTVNALHPGVITTKLLREGFGGGGRSLEEGAKTSVFLAASDRVEGKTGEYYVNSHPAQSSPTTHKKPNRKHLMEISQKLTGLELRSFTDG